MNSCAWEKKCIFGIFGYFYSATSFLSFGSTGAPATQGLKNGKMTRYFWIPQSTQEATNKISYMSIYWKLRCFKSCLCISVAYLDIRGHPVLSKYDFKSLTCCISNDGSGIIMSTLTSSSSELSLKSTMSSSSPSALTALRLEYLQKFLLCSKYSCS